MCACLCVCVHLSVSRCARGDRAAILEVKWLQEEHSLHSKPPSSDSPPKFNFPGASASISSKKEKEKWRLSLPATLRSKMRLRFAVNTAEQTMQRSHSIYRGKKLVLCVFELSFSELSSALFSSLILSFSSRSGYMELYPWRSHRHEEKEPRARLQSSSQHATSAQVSQVHGIIFSQTQHCPLAAKPPGCDVRERYSNCVTSNNCMAPVMGLLTCTEVSLTL